MRRRSIRCHADCRSDTASITSPVVTPTAGWRSLPASMIDVASVSGVTPTVAASFSHRSRRCSVSWPVLRVRVSRAASRPRAARSKRFGSRPSRSTNSATFSVIAASISAVRFENRASRFAGTPLISAWPLTIWPNPTPRRSVSSARRTDW